MRYENDRVLEGDKTMGNIMTSIYVGESGLRVNQASLNTSAHNLSNVDTKGYVRQQTVGRDFGYISVGKSHSSGMNVGLGADMQVIRQVRNSFLDKSYRLEVGRQGFYESQLQAITEIEDLFGEMEGVQFQNSMSDIWSSVQELAKEPDSIVTRSTLVQTAVSFIERAENISNQLKKFQKDLNIQVQDQVDRINEIGEEIMELNRTIQKYEANGEHANDYRDNRNLLLDELGSMVSITYKEDMRGVVSVNVEGIQFVSDTLSKLETKEIEVPYTYIDENGDETEELRPTGMLDVKWEGSSGSYLYPVGLGYSIEAKTDCGSLKGLLIARGNRAANYTDIPILPEKEDFTTYDEEGESDFDEDGYLEAVAAYNVQMEDYNDNVKPSIIMSVQAEFDQLIHGIVTTINDIFCPNVVTDETDDNDNPIRILDPFNAPVGMDENSTAGQALFNRKVMDRYTYAEDFSYIDEEGNEYEGPAYIYNEEKKYDKYSLFTLGNIEVNEEILKNVSLIPLSDAAGTGDYDLVASQKLMEAWDTKFAALNPDNLIKCNFMDYYKAMIGDYANRGGIITSLKDNQQDMVTNIDNQRLSTMGVSSDEELVNMIKYQHAYNASARYVNTVSEMLEHIITRLGA